MDISYLSGTILFIVAFLNLLFAFLLWSRGKDKATFHLGWAAFFSAVYVFTWAGLYLFEGNKALWIRLTWLGTFVLPPYLAFVYYFTGRTKYFKRKIFPWYLGVFIISFLALTTSYIVNDNLLPEYPYVSSETAGPLNPLGRVYLIFGLALALFYLLKEYQKSQETRKLQIKYLIWGLMIYGLGAGLTGGVIPLFYPESYGYVLPFSAFFSVFLVIFAAYAIFKKQVFGIRIILTEILVISIGFILFIQFLLAPNLSTKSVNFFLFFSFSAVGYLLIKATYSEIKKKKETERLAKELFDLNLTLKEKVREKTAELEEEKVSLEIKVKARTQELQELAESLDEQVEERTKELQEKINELERFQRLTVGRELKMIELKEGIKKLKEGLEKNKPR